MGEIVGDGVAVGCEGKGDTLNSTALHQNPKQGMMEMQLEGHSHTACQGRQSKLLHHYTTTMQCT